MVDRRAAAPAGAPGVAEAVDAEGSALGLRSLIAGTALIVAGVLPGFMTASLAPRIRDDFAFGDSTVGLAVALFYVVCTLLSPPSGHLVERIGAVRGMRLGGAATAVACLGIALAARSAAALIALLIVAGVGNAMGGPAVSALLKRDVPSHRRGLAFGAQQSGASLGALLAGLALPVVAIPLGWRWAYAGTVVLAVAAAAAAPGPRRPPPGGARAGTRGRGPASVYLLAVVAGLASAAGVGLVAFLVLYAVHSGLSEGQAGLLLGAMSLGATVSRIALGALADRPGQEPLRPVAAMLIVSVAGYLLLIPGRPGAIVVGTLLAGSVGWAWPGALTLAVVERSRDAPAWAVGVMMAGLFAGAVGGPLVVGLLADHGAFAAAWAVCAAFALLAAATVVAVRRLDRRSPRLAA